MIHSAMFISVLAVVMLSALWACAQLQPAPLFGDHMVIQQGMPLRVWGRGEAGAKVVVRLADQTRSAITNDEGRWSLVMDPVEAGGKLELAIASGTDEFIFTDLLVGEVWLASGQSNMAEPLKRLPCAQAEIPDADWPEIRIFTVGKNPVLGAAAEHCPGQWTACTPETVGEFSAVGYFFARELHRKLKRPIGVIVSAVGGTPIESWMDRDVLKGIPAIWDQVLLMESKQKQWNQAAVDAEYEEELAAWSQASRRAAAEGRDAPDKPGKPVEPRLAGWQPASLYNGMIAPLAGYAIKGVIWYQGESNARRPETYEQTFAALITSWRSRWAQGAFPFYYVQLANFETTADWPSLRQAQLKTLTLPATGMAVTIDIGDVDNIHPTNKLDIARRLARWPLARDYGIDIACSGPLYESSTVEGDAIRVRFTHADDGLIIRDGAAPSGFEIAGDDGVFVEAEAMLDGRTVVVGDPRGLLKHPRRIRYGWENNPSKANLYNGAGLPASPFLSE